MRDFFYFLTLFDWLSLPASILRGLWKNVDWDNPTLSQIFLGGVWGGDHSFIVSETGQWTAGNVYYWLQDAGIEAFNFGYYRRGFFFYVRREDVEAAAGLLIAWGCPFDNDPSFF
jgi:hypothetical protein